MKVTFDYDDDGRPAAITHSGGYRVSVTVERGRIARLTSGDVTLVSYEYDEDGSLAGVVNSSGQSLCLTYDSAGRFTGWTDRNGHSSLYDYDNLGRCVLGESSSARRRAPLLTHRVVPSGPTSPGPSPRTRSTIRNTSAGSPIRSATWPGLDTTTAAG